MSDTNFDPYYKWLGIPPTDRPATLYRLLGLTDFESDTEVINAAADQRMMLLRSHQNGRHAGQSQTLLNEISQARNTLLDASRKATYDAQLQAQAASQLQATMHAAPVAQAVASPSAPQKAKISINTNKGKRRGVPTVAILTGALVLLVFGGAGIALMYNPESGAEVASGEASPTIPSDNVQPPAVPPQTTGGSQPADGLQPTIGDIGTSTGVETSADGEAPVSTDGSPASIPATDGGPTTTGGSEEPDTTDPLTAGGASTPVTVEDPFATPSKPDQYDPARYAGPSVNLLKELNVSKDTLNGETLQKDGVFFTDSEYGVSAVNLPGTTPAAYELRIDVERAAGDGAMLLGLQMGTQDVALAIDELPAAGPHTGFRELNGNALGSALNQGLKERVIDLSGVTTLTVEVRPNHVGLKHKDQQIFTWTGSSNTLGQGQNFKKTPGKLAIGSINCKLKISRVEMQPLKTGLGELAGQPDEPKVDFGAGIVEDPFGPPGGVTNPGGFPGSLPSPGVVSRSKMPDETDVTKARARAKSVFADQITEARTPEQKNLLAQTFQKTAIAETEPANQYALLVLARETALEAGNLQLAMQTIQDAANRIEIDASLETSELLTEILSRPSAPQVRIAAVTAALETVPALMTGKNYDAAIELSRAGYTAASRLRGTRQMAQFKKFRTSAEQLKGDYDLAMKAETYLKTNPDNEKANLAWGKHLAFAEGDWDAAAPFLAKSGIDYFVKAVKAESQADDDTGRLAAGAAWKATAESLKPPHQYAALRRARYWYQKVVESGSGFDATEAKNHVATIDKTLTGAGVATGDANNKGAAGTMVGRVKIGGQDSGLLVQYRTGATLQQTEIDQKLTFSTSTRGISLELHGILVLQQAGNVQFRHSGGSADGGRLYLKIDGRTVSRVGDDRSKSVTETIPLAAGLHRVAWAIRGGQIGSCLIDFTRLPSVPGGAETPLTVVATPQMKAIARNPVVNGEITFD